MPVPCRRSSRWFLAFSTLQLLSLHHGGSTCPNNGESRFRGCVFEQIMTTPTLGKEQFCV